MHIKEKLALFLGMLANAGGQSFLLVTLPPLGRRLGLLDIQVGGDPQHLRSPLHRVGAALALAAFSAIVQSRITGRNDCRSGS